MRIKWYQGRMWVVFNYPNGTPITTLMYPNMDVRPEPPHNYDYKLQQYKTRTQR